LKEIQNTSDVPVVAAAQRWHRLANEYEARCCATTSDGPITSAICADRATRLDADLYQASFYLAYLARRTGIDPLPLLKFARRPDAGEALLAARLVVDQLLVEPGQTEADMVERSHPGRDELLTLDDVRRYVPGEPSYSTIYRWITKGCGGVRLESWIRGGTACTTLGAIERFSAAIAAKRMPAGPEPAPQTRIVELRPTAVNQSPESREAELRLTIESLERAGF